MMFKNKKFWLFLDVFALVCVCGVHCNEDDVKVPPSDQSNSNDFPDLSALDEVSEPDDVPQISEWKERCREEVGEQAVKEMENATSHLTVCVSNIINWDKLQHEINRSIPRGELDLVFKKYCGRRERLMVCVEDMFTKIEACMNENERRDLNVTRAAINAGLDFVCHNDGDRIALFMGEKGEECIKSQRDNIKECVEERVPEVKDVKEDPLSINLDQLLINEENCKKVTAMHHCVVEWTEKCDDSTPANILDSLITQVLKVTPCKEVPVTPGPLSAARDLVPCMLTLFGAALTAANILL
ncbi:hypothetical protein SK128_027793 [Halocaridina rubra]|uniref:Uncharacterized protein n=1 Tax=Halocaridina rubra TaxID=373956 RepID=A0AAN8XB18_HALRR